MRKKAAYHPPAHLLPDRFTFPQQYLDYVNQDQSSIPAIDPWYFLCFYPESFDDWLAILREQYPARKLVPFAKFSFSDDIACFDATHDPENPTIHYIQCFTPPGCEERRAALNFGEWVYYALHEATKYLVDHFYVADGEEKKAIREQFEDTAWYRDQFEEYVIRYRIYHPSAEILPEKFKYPQEYLDYINEERVPDIEPWFFLCFTVETVEDWIAILREQFPDRILIPFAKDGGSDDVACFDATHDPEHPTIHYIHTFTKPGYEERGMAANFGEWLYYVLVKAHDYLEGKIEAEEDDDIAAMKKQLAHLALQCERFRQQQ